MAFEEANVWSIEDQSIVKSIADRLSGEVAGSEPVVCSLGDAARYILACGPQNSSFDSARHFLVSVVLQRVLSLDELVEVLQDLLGDDGLYTPAIDREVETRAEFGRSTLSELQELMSAINLVKKPVAEITGEQAFYMCTVLCGSILDDWFLLASNVKPDVRKAFLELAAGVLQSLSVTITVSDIKVHINKYGFPNAFVSKALFPWVVGFEELDDVPLDVFEGIFRDEDIYSKLGRFILESLNPDNAKFCLEGIDAVKSTRDFFGVVSSFHIRHFGYSSVFLFKLAKAIRAIEGRLNDKVAIAALNDVLSCMADERLSHEFKCNIFLEGVRRLFDVSTRHDDAFSVLLNYLEQMPLPSDCREGAIAESRMALVVSVKALANIADDDLKPRIDESFHSFVRQYNNLLVGSPDRVSFGAGFYCNFVASGRAITSGDDTVRVAPRL